MAVGYPIGLAEFHMHLAAAMFFCFLAPGTFDKDSAHGLCGGGEEVAAAVPVLNLLQVHESNVGLMDQTCGLERLSWFLLCQLDRCQLAQLVIDQRQELAGGVWIALLDGGQDVRDVAHVPDNKPEMTG